MNGDMLRTWSKRKATEWGLYAIINLYGYCPAGAFRGHGTDKKRGTK